MLMPDKHIRVSESLLGLGSFVLEALCISRSMDELWGEFQEQARSGTYPAHHSFENLILAIDMLFSIGAVELDKNGNLTKCS